MRVAAGIFHRHLIVVSRPQQVAGEGVVSVVADRFVFVGFTVVIGVDEPVRVSGFIVGYRRPGNLAGVDLNGLVQDLLQGFDFLSDSFAVVTVTIKVGL